MLLPPEEEFVSHDITEQGLPVRLQNYNPTIRIAMDRALVPHPENSLAELGSHGRRMRRRAEVTGPCDSNHKTFSCGL